MNFRSFFIATLRKLNTQPPSSSRFLSRPMWPLPAMFLVPSPLYSILDLAKESVFVHGWDGLCPFYLFLFVAFWPCRHPIRIYGKRNFFIWSWCWLSWPMWESMYFRVPCLASLDDFHPSTLELWWWAKPWVEWSHPWSPLLWYHLKWNPVFWDLLALVPYCFS